MNLGKCKSCNKTVYQMESVSVGPPGQEMIFHDKCFKCSEPGCTWKLNYSNYCFSDGHPWCKNHNPMTGTSNTLARTMSSGRGIAPKTQAAPAPARVNSGGAGCNFCPDCGTNVQGCLFCANCGCKVPQ